MNADRTLEVALIAVCLQEGDGYVLEDESLVEASRGAYTLESAIVPGGTRLTLKQSVPSPFDVVLEEPTMHIIDEPDEPAPNYGNVVRGEREPLTRARVVPARSVSRGLRARAWDTPEDLVWQDEVGADGEQPDRVNGELRQSDGSVSASMIR